MAAQGGANVYRTPVLPESAGGLVTVRRYLDPLNAQMDRAHLEGAGIRAYVIEGASFNPLLGGVGGGVQLQVSERDVEQAEAILDAAAPADAAGGDDGEAPGAVRCPRCELSYCSFERDRLRGNTGHPLSVLVSLPWLLFGKKRWHCARCEHVWDDPKEGPAEMTRLEPSEPRPVFRLRRAHAGMGLMIGLVAGFFVSVVAGGALGGLLGLAVIGAAWLVGASLRYEVCSEPECRAPLLPGAEECSRCKGSVAGEVRAAAEHYAAAADVRRELAALRASTQLRAEARAKAGLKKKKAARAAEAGEASAEPEDAEASSDQRATTSASARRSPLG